MHHIKGYEDSWVCLVSSEADIENIPLLELKARCFPPYSFETVSLTNPGAPCFPAGLADQQGPMIFLSMTEYNPNHTGLFPSARNLNAGPRALIHCLRWL